MAQTRDTRINSLEPVDDTKRGAREMRLNSSLPLSVHWRHA